MGSELSESQWMLFAIIIWSTVLCLFILVLRLVRGRPFFKSSKDRKSSHGLDNR